jgi:NTE family protein
VSYAVKVSRHSDSGPADSRPRLALVLGAGGARGLAHIGALRVFAREGVDFDLLVGASMGSLIGATYAAGLPMESVQGLVMKVRARQVLRFRAGGSGLIDPSGLRAVLEGVFGKRTFADLGVPLAVVTASLRHGGLAVLREGPLVPALLAATAIPLVFPPVHLNDDWLADGGLVDGLPVSVARQLGAERVVAVDADIHGAQLLRSRLVAPVVTALQRRLLSRTHERPTHQLILGRWLECILRDRSSHELPDVLIKPSFGRITSNHFHRRAYCINLGEYAAERALPEVLALWRESDNLSARS